MPFKDLINNQEIISEVYCQVCGERLTKKGGIVTGDGYIYCGGVLWCEEKGLLRKTLPPDIDFMKPKDIQTSIQEGNLIHFSKPHISV
jgi:hypothetical protein